MERKPPRISGFAVNGDTVVGDYNTAYRYTNGWINVVKIRKQEEDLPPAEWLSRTHLVRISE